MRLCKKILTIAVVMALILASAVTAYAATISVSWLPDTITVDSSKTSTAGEGGWTVEGTIISGTTKGGSLGLKWTGQHTLTFTFAEAGEITFDWKLTSANGGSMTVNGTKYTTTGDSGTFSKVVASGDTVTVVITSVDGGGPTTGELSNVGFVAHKAINVTFKPVEGVSYVVEGTTVSTETGAQTVSLAWDATSATITPTYTAEGVVIREWVLPSGVANSLSETSIVKPTEDTTLTPVLASASVPRFRLESTGVNYYDLNPAITAANGNGVITVVSDGILPAAEYTIPKGVTLLVPFDAVHTLITDDMEDHVDDTDISPDHSNSPTKTLYRQLTMAANAKIIVADGGAISVSSRASKEMEGQVGPYGAIQMESGSNITVQSGGTLYAWGYVQGSGTVTVQSGGTVHENISVMDFTHDVGQALNLYGNAGSGITNIGDNLSGGHTYPVRTMTLLNVEVPMTLEYGATNIGFFHLWGSVAGGMSNNMEYIGSSDDAIFQLTEEGATLTKSYANGRQAMVTNGSATLNPINIKFTFLGISVTLASEKVPSGFPLPSHFDITINSGNAKVSTNILMCEGATLTIAEGASLDFQGNRLVVLDADEDPGAYASNDRYGTQFTNVNTDAVLNINGTLNIAEGGGLYTTAGKAAIISSNGTGVLKFAGENSALSTIKVKTSYNSSQEVTVQGAYLKNANNTYTNEIETGTYNYINGFWHLGTCADNAGNAATCTTAQTCTVCGYEITAALGHSWNDGEVTTAPTCTAAGVKTFTCSVCSHTYTEAVAAAGHSYGEGVVTDPTCTVDGFTTYTCSVCGYTYTDSEVAALGHSDSNLDCRCDSCGERMCIDSNDDHSCDNCGKPMCIDSNTDGKCDTCGAFICKINFIEGAYKAEVVLRLYLDIPDALLENDTATVTLTKDGRWGDVEFVYTTAQLKEAGKTQYGYIVEAGVASGEIARDISVEIVYAEDGAKKMATLFDSSGNCLGKSTEFSVLYYSELTYRMGNEKQKTMMDALLSYGYYAELYFDVDSENRIKNLMTQFERQIANLEGIDKNTPAAIATQTGGGFGITVNSIETHLDSAVFMKLIFASDEAPSAYTFTLTRPNSESTQLTTDGENPEVYYDANSKTCYVEIRDIPAAYMDDAYTVTIKRTADDQTYVVSINVLRWVQQALTYSTNENQINLAKAIYNYNQAADVFFSE